jgi:hypothetical protein
MGLRMSEDVVVKGVYPSKVSIINNFSTMELAIDPALPSCEFLNLIFKEQMQAQKRRECKRGCAVIRFVALQDVAWRGLCL